MDACNYCREYHKPHEVCDAYIEWLKKQVKVEEKDLVGGPTKATAAR